MTAADFDAAARAAAEIDAQLDAEQPGAQPEQGEQPQPDAAQDEQAKRQAELDENKAGLAMILEGIKLAAQPVFPTAAALYTPAIIESIAEKGAAVMAKHGLSLGGEFAKWREEIALVWVLGPLIIATVKAVKLDLERSAADRAKEVKPDAAPVADSLPTDGQRPG